MRCKSVLSSLVVLLTSSTIASSQVRIQHLPVKWSVAGQPITIRATVEDPRSEIDLLKLYYRKGGEESYLRVDMERMGEEYVGEIPAEDVLTGRLEYFIMAISKGRVVATYPEVSPYFNPVEVSITAPKPTERPSQEGTPLKILILSPRPGEKVPPEEVVIAVSIFAEEGQLDLSSIVLRLDGMKLDAQVTPNLISAVVPGGLRKGRHRIRLSWRDSKGRRLKPVEWTFSVARGKGALSQFEGRFFAETIDEKISGNRLSTTNIGLQVFGQYGVLDYRGLAFLTSRERRDEQPRNRFLFSVGLPLLKVKFGDTHPQFSDLILWGRRVRGIETNLRLGFFNIDFVMGQTERAIEGVVRKDFCLDPVTGDTLFVDPLTGDTTTTNTGVYLYQDTITRYGTFEQNLIGIRPSFGNGKHFQWGFNLLKVKDETSSIRYGIEPKDNLVIGSDVLLAFDNHRLAFKAGVAFSLLTEDISSGPLTKADIDSAFETDIPFDPQDFEKYLILNTSTVPLDPSGGSSLAYNASLKFNYFNNYLLVRYKSIGSEYNTLGNPFLRRDIQGFSITDRLRLFRNRLYLTFEYEDYLDNFSKRDERPSTNLRTFRSVIDLYLGRGLPNISLSFKDYNRNNGITQIDTTQRVIGGIVVVDSTDRREDSTTQDFSLRLNYRLNLFGLDHSIALSTFKSDRVDAFKETRLSDNLSSELGSEMRIISLKTIYNFPLTTYISYATTDNSYSGGAHHFKFDSFNLKGEYRLFQNKLMVYAGLGKTSASGRFSGAIIDYTKTNFNLGGFFKPRRGHLLRFDFNFINFKDKGISATGLRNPSYKDRIIKVRYEARF